MSMRFYMIETTVKRLDQQDMTWSFREPVLLFSSGRLSMSVEAGCWAGGWSWNYCRGLSWSYCRSRDCGLRLSKWWSWAKCDCVPLEIARISILVSFCWWGRSWMLSVDGMGDCRFRVEVTAIPEVGMLSWIWESCGVGVGMVICLGMWVLLEIDCSSRFVSCCCGSCWSWDESRRSDSSAVASVCLVVRLESWDVIVGVVWEAWPVPGVAFWVGSPCGSFKASWRRCDKTALFPVWRRFLDFSSR